MKQVGDILKKYKNSDKDIILHGADFISQKGYTLIPNYVLRTEKVSGYAKLVYAILLSYAWGNKNSSFPGQETLAKDSGISLSSVKRALNELQNQNFITVIRRGLNRTNVYILHFKRK